jgi:hypothetical protein
MQGPGGRGNGANVLPPLPPMPENPNASPNPQQTILNNFSALLPEYILPVARRIQESQEDTSVKIRLFSEHLWRLIDYLDPQHLILSPQTVNTILSDYFDEEDAEDDEDVLPIGVVTPGVRFVYYPQTPAGLTPFQWETFQSYLRLFPYGPGIPPPAERVRAVEAFVRRFQNPAAALSFLNYYYPALPPTNSFNTRQVRFQGQLATQYVVGDSNNPLIVYTFSAEDSAAAAEMEVGADPLPIDPNIQRPPLSIPGFQPGFQAQLAGPGFQGPTAQPGGLLVPSALPPTAQRPQGNWPGQAPPAQMPQNPPIDLNQLTGAAAAFAQSISRDLPGFVERSLVTVEDVTSRAGYLRRYLQDMAIRFDPHLATISPAVINDILSAVLAENLALRRRFRDTGVVPRYYPYDNRGLTEHQARVFGELSFMFSAGFDALSQEEKLQRINNLFGSFSAPAEAWSFIDFYLDARPPRADNGRLVYNVSGLQRSLGYNDGPGGLFHALVSTSVTEAQSMVLDRALDPPRRHPYPPVTVIPGLPLPSALPRSSQPASAIPTDPTVRPTPMFTTPGFQMPTQIPTTTQPIQGRNIGGGIQFQPGLQLPPTTTQPIQGRNIGGGIQFQPPQGQGLLMPSVVPQTLQPQPGLQLPTSQAPGIVPTAASIMQNPMVRNFAVDLRTRITPILTGPDPARGFAENSAMLIELIWNLARMQDRDRQTLTPAVINTVLRTILPADIEFTYYPPSELGLSQNQWQAYTLLQNLFGRRFLGFNWEQQRTLLESIVRRFSNPARAATFLRKYVEWGGSSYISLVEMLGDPNLYVYPVETQGFRPRAGDEQEDPIYTFTGTAGAESAAMVDRGEIVEPDRDNPISISTVQTQPGLQLPQPQAPDLKTFVPVVDMGTLTGDFDVNEPTFRFRTRIVGRKNYYIPDRDIYNPSRSEIVANRIRTEANRIDPTGRVLTPGVITHSLLQGCILDRPYVHMASGDGLTAGQNFTYDTMTMLPLQSFWQRPSDYQREVFTLIIEGFEFRAQALAFFWLLRANYPELFDILSDGSSIRIYSTRATTRDPWLAEFSEEERDQSLLMLSSMPIDPAPEQRVHPPRPPLPESGRPWVNVPSLTIIHSNKPQPANYLKSIWPAKAWEQALLNGISSEPFQQATDSEKAAVLHYMREQTSLPLSLFNELLYRIWPHGGLPVPQIQADKTQLTYVQHWEGPYELNPLNLRNYYDQSATTPATVNVGRGNPAPWRLGRLRNYIDSLFDAELRDHPRDDRISKPLRQLSVLMSTYINDIWPSQGDVPTQDFATVVTGWRERALEILRQRKALGRRCRNAADPFTLEEADEIPENEFIRMQTGYCWNINSLLDYVQETTNGDNDATQLENYGSPHLWHNDAELQRIADHEAAQARDFRNWLENAMIGSISQNTLDMMYVTAQVQISRGPAWSFLVQRNLDPWYYQQFMKYTGGDFYRLQNVPELLIGGQNGRPATRDEIERYRAIGIDAVIRNIVEAERNSKDARTEKQVRRAFRDGDITVEGFWQQQLPPDVIPLRQNLHEMIRVQLKRTILNDFWAYYNKLSQAEKDALERAKKNFFRDLNSCYKGTNCVYIWARVLFQTIRKVAPLKGLTHYEEFDTAEPGF